MIDRGALLAQTYQMPQQAPVQQQPKPEQPFQDEVGQPEDMVQQIDGVTGDYFNKWAALKGFARDVQENLGIDVRYPDPSIPESTRLHQIYLKALADLKKQGSRLKVGQREKEADRARGSMVTEKEGAYYDEYNVGTDIVDTKLDPIVQEANNKLQAYHYGGAYKQATQYYEQIKGRLEELIRTQPDKAGYWQRQLDALTPPNMGVKEWDPYRGQRQDRNKGRINAAGHFTKKVANMMSGTAAGYKLSDDEFGPNGERVWVNKDFEKGVNYGGAEIVEWQYIPSTKETYLKVRKMDSKTGQYRTEKVALSGADAVSIAKTLTSENPRFAVSGEYIDQFADEAGYFSDAGEVDPSILLTKDAPDIYKRMTDEETTDNSKREKAKVAQIDTDLRSMKPHTKKAWWNFANDKKQYIGKDGKSISIVSKESDDEEGVVYEIENIRELVPGQKSYAQFKSMSADQVKKFLLDRGVLATINAPSGTQSAPSPTAAKPADPLSGTVPAVDPAEEAKRLLEQYRSGKK